MNSKPPAERIEDEMDILQKIKHKRNELGYTQAYMGHILGITEKAYSKIETGKNSLGIQYIAPLCNALGLSCSELINELFGVAMDKTSDGADKKNQMTKRNDFSYMKEIIDFASRENIAEEKGHWSSDGNACICGDARTGKTYHHVKTNLLSMCGSYIVSDYGGMIYGTVRRTMKENGYRIMTLNLNEPDLSCRYNPLANVHDFEQARTVSECILENSGYYSWKGKNTHNFDAATNMLVAFILRQCLMPEQERTLPSVIRKMESMVSAMAHKNADGLAEYLEVLSGRRGVPEEISSYCASVRYTSPEFLKYMLKSCLEMMSGIRGNSAIEKLMGGNDINFDEMRRNKTAVFLLPDSGGKCSFLIPLLYEQAFSCLHKTKNGNHVYCIMDEFPNIGRFPYLARHMRGMDRCGISVTLIMQTIGQVRSAYPNNEWQDIIGQCRKHILYGSCDPWTLEYFAEILLPYMKNIRNGSNATDGIPDIVKGLSCFPKDKYMVCMDGRRPLINKKCGHT